MQDAIQHDTRDQVDRLVAQLRATLDPSEYPKPDDGSTFDARLRALEHEFERVKRVFHDCLMVQWSSALGREVRKQLDASQSNTDGNEGAKKR